MSNRLDINVSHMFDVLPQNGASLATYVWLGNNTREVNMRSKTKVMLNPPKSLKDFEDWNYDGSSTDQAPTNDSEIICRPCYYCRDPFNPNGDNYLVLCDTYRIVNGIEVPTSDNKRHIAKDIFDKVSVHEPWYGLEQEYVLMDPSGDIPFGWTDKAGTGMRQQGPYYCGVGADNALGRQVSDAHLKACLYAGVKICGTNLEVFPAQLEYQIGPCLGIDIGDHMWMSRYILSRVCELFGVTVSFAPKPVYGWNGSGCHTNYSTKETRDPKIGWETIMLHMERLSRYVPQHMAVYGADNEKRLTGDCETQSFLKFDYDVGSRSCSIRIPRTTDNNKCGYYEDRRPAANIDPYAVSAVIAATTLLDQEIKWQ